MKNALTGLKVGIFVVIVLVTTWYSIHAVTEGIGGQSGYKVYALFNDATGLVDKSQVQIAGLRVGQIVNRSLYGKKAKIDIYLKNDIVLYENSSVTKKVASLMGGYYLEIDPGTPEIIDPVTGQKRKSKKLSKGEQIPIALEPTTTGEIINKVGGLIPEIQKLVQEVRILSKTKIASLVQNTDKAIVTNGQALKRLIDRIDGLAKDIKQVSGTSAGDIKTIVRNLKDTSYAIKNIVNNTGGKINGMGSDLQASLSKLNKIMDKLEKSVSGNNSIVDNTRSMTKNLKDITEKINTGKGTVGKFINNDQIADDIQQITSDAKTFVGGLTSLETVVGLRTEYNLMANTVKTYISVAIYPRQDKFYLIELIDDPRGTRNTSYTVTKTDNPELGPSIYRTEELTVTDSFRFTFMFGKKVDFLTFRFGIKESTGGFGIDLNLLDNKFIINTDLFDFSSNIYPRLKVGLMWEFYKRMFIFAGVDDLMNDRPKTGAGGGRDFYIGAQLRFTDEDLKSLLMVGGSSLGGILGGGSKK